MIDHMHPRVYWIQEKETDPGQLGIMPRPGGDDQLDTDIKSLKKQGVNTLVCLVEQWEQKALGLTAEESICAKYEIEFLHFPIPDFGVPADDAGFMALVHDLAGRLGDGKKVVVHCHGGIGRSSIVAAGVLWKRGVALNSVFEIIGRHREHQVPETTEQKLWFEKINRKIT